MVQQHSLLTVNDFQKELSEINVALAKRPEKWME